MQTSEHVVESERYNALRLTLALLRNDQLAIEGEMNRGETYAECRARIIGEAANTLAQWIP